MEVGGEEVKYMIVIAVPPPRYRSLLPEIAPSVHPHLWNPPRRRQNRERP